MKIAKSKPNEIRFNHIDESIVTLGTFIPFEIDNKTENKPIVIISDREQIWFEVLKDEKYIFKVHGVNYQLNGYPFEMDTMLSLEAFFQLFGDDPKENMPIPIDKINIKYDDISPKILLEDIQRFIRKFVGFYTIDMKYDDGLYDLLSHWILYTHIYDIWDTCSYLKFMGDYDSGKSTISQAVKLLSFTASSTEAHISDAAFRRELHTVGGVKLLDEITLTRKDMVTFQNLLKSGIQRDATSKVVNHTDYKKLDAFRSYCPKVVAGTDCENMEVVLSSRMIEFTMRKAPKKAALAKENIFSPKSKEEARKIRDRTYFFRLFHGHEFLHWNTRLNITKYFKDSDLSNRFYDIYAPLFTISGYVSGKHVTKSLEDAANEQMEMRRIEIYNQLDVPILRVLFTTLHRCEDDGEVWMTDAEISNEIIILEISARNGIYDRKTLTDKYSPESVGTRIRGMGISKEHKGTALGLQHKYVKKTIIKAINQKNLDFTWLSLSEDEQIEQVVVGMTTLSIIHPLGLYSTDISNEIGFQCQSLLKSMEDKGLVKFENSKWSLIK